MATTGTPLNIVKMDDSDRTPYSRFNTAVQAINDYLGGTGAGAPVWVSWTPTWTNLTVGNGTVSAKYAQIGKLVMCRMNIIFGTTTSVAGDIQFSLPVTTAAYAGAAGLHGLGKARAYDFSGALVYEGIVMNHSTTVAAARWQLASGTYVTQVLASSTIPFTWDDPDEITADFIYEAA